MLVHPWDAALDDDEWRSWIADGHDFGQLCVNGEPGHPPAVVPTHFAVDGDHLLVHLARPNPVWQAIEGAPDVTRSIGVSRTTVRSRLRMAERLLNRDLLPLGPGTHDLVYALRITDRAS